MTRARAAGPWPRGLVGQLLLVTALALLVAQALGMHLLVRAGQHERLSEISGFASARIVGAVDRAAIDRAAGIDAAVVPDRADRQAARGEPRRARHQRHRRGAVRIVARPPAALATDRWPELSARVTSLLAGSSYDFDTVRSVRLTRERTHPPGLATGFDSDPVFVGARLTDGRWVVTRVFARVPRGRLPTALLIQTALIYLLLLGPIMWIGWRVSRPLRRLSDAVAEPVGLAHPPPVAPSGPDDVRDLIAGFNTMRDRIAAMLADKDRMLGAIGHDLRTPLASLRVRLESVDDDELRDRMVGSVDAITAMLDDILSLARAGRSQEPAVDTDIAALTDALVEDYRDMGRDVTFTDSGGGTVRVRRDLLRRAIRNLVDNALKYGVRARLRVDTTPAGVVIEVRDDGPGIAADRVAALTEPFARDESSRNRDTGGAGLGLAIAKTIVEHEGGRLVLANAPDGGLAARIELNSAALRG